MSNSDLSIFDGDNDFDLQFYVSLDGKQTAMSFSGLSRLIKGDPDWKPLRRLLNTLDTNYQENNRLQEVPPNLKHLVGKAFVTGQEFGVNKNRLIKSFACADIIEHFADLLTIIDKEAQYLYPVARDSRKKLTPHGVDALIKKLAGYQEPTSDNALLLEVLSLVKQQDKRFDEIQKELRAVKYVQNTYPVIGRLARRIYSGKALKVSDRLPERFTIRQFALIYLRRNLSPGQCRSLGSFVKKAITLLTGKAPSQKGVLATYTWDLIDPILEAYYAWDEVQKQNQ